MARIKIKDLPIDAKITKEEMKRVKGGAFDSFLKIDGFASGESTDDKHKDWIEITYPYSTR